MWNARDRQMMFKWDKIIVRDTETIVKSIRFSGKVI